MKNYISLLKVILSSGMTQKELSERLGVTFAALSRWLHSHAVPHPKRIHAIEKLHRQLIGFSAFDPVQIKALVSKAEKYKRTYIQKIISSSEDLLKELVLEHTYNSTTIEGNTMTKRETEAVIFANEVIPDKSVIEHLEMTNHAAVLKRILKGEYGVEISEDLIRFIHRDLMHSIREDAGQYSKYHRAIRGLDIALTHPDDISEEMRDLVQKWKKKKQTTIKEIADFHVSFELIHPFGDGNGRVGRLILLLQCLKANYLPLIIENEKKMDYYEVLEYAQKKSDGPFIAFLIRELDQTNRLFKKYRK